MALSTASAALSPNDIVGYGKWGELTYEELWDQQPEYCLWTVNKFQELVKEGDELATKYVDGESKMKRLNQWITATDAIRAAVEPQFECDSDMEQVEIENPAAETLGKRCAKLREEKDFQSSKFYGVALPEDHAGVYTSWGECKPHVVGVKGVMYKSFTTEEEAVEYVRNPPARIAPVVSPEVEAARAKAKVEREEAKAVKAAEAAEARAAAKQVREEEKAAKAAEAKAAKAAEAKAAKEAKEEAKNAKAAEKASKRAAVPEKTAEDQKPKRSRKAATIEDGADSKMEVSTIQSDADAQAEEKPVKLVAGKAKGMFKKAAVKAKAKAKSKAKAKAKAKAKVATSAKAKAAKSTPEAASVEVEKPKKVKQAKVGPTLAEKEKMRAMEKKIKELERQNKNLAAEKSKDTSVQPKAKAAASKADSSASPSINDELLKRANELGMCAALQNLASRPDIVAKGFSHQNLLDALVQADGLVNKAKSALLCPQSDEITPAKESRPSSLDLSPEKAEEERKEKQDQEALAKMLGNLDATLRLVSGDVSTPVKDASVATQPDVEMKVALQSGLTDAQVQRIKENRERALARKAQAGN